MKVIVPPIKSQGIKTKLVPWINALIPQNDGVWIEPFMGTGVVAFNVGFRKNLLSDVNPHLINFYNSVKTGEITPAIVREYLYEQGEILRNSPEDGYQHYRFVRERFNNSFSPLDFLFLSRAGFNGMIRFNNKGKWNIPFCKKPNRFSKAYITKIVNQVAVVSSLINNNWQFQTKDFREVIYSANENDIIYCDPPYYGRYVDYYNGWNENDENDLYEALNKTKARFILSTWHHNDYRDNSMINKFWKNFNIVTRSHFYHSGGKIENRNAIVEALVFNFNSQIKEYQYEIVPEGKQLFLFEERAKYISDKISESVHVHA